MTEINPVTKDQLFEKKIAENTGSDYNVGDISNVIPVTKDQALLKEIALNSAGQSGDITELEEKVTELEAIVNRGSVSVTADGVKTYRQLLNELYTLIDFNKVTGQSYLRVEASYLHICTVAGGYYGNASVYEGMPQIVSVFLDANDSLYDIYYSGANHDEKNTVAPSGRIFTMYY